MKKILTILASAATLIAFGDGEPINYATFEAAGYTAGEAFSTATNDYGGESTPLYWYTADTDASNVISNYPSLGTKGPIALRPDYVKNDVNDKFLQIETSGRLYRTIKDNEGHGDFLTPQQATITNYTVSVDDSPIYLDTLVKFTAADSAFGDDGLENGDKIAISYVEHEAEDDDPYTNFVVRAGRFVGENSTLTNENYFVAVPEGFDKDAWHRLTVRTIADVGDGSVGFVVYLDETILTYSTEFDAGFGTLNPVAKNFYDTTKHALFPSAVGKDKLEGKTISYAAFSGNGSLDDVVFTTAMPVFIATNESVSVEFTVDSGVTAISVQVGEEEPVVVNMQTLTVALPPATTAFTVKATIDEGNGYGFSSMTIGEASYDTNPANITGYAGDTIVITTARNNFNVFDVNGDPISGKYQTLGAALAATGVAKIQLAYDYTVTDSDIPDGYIDILQSTTLDLNGKTLDGGESVSDPLFMVSDGNFVIIDSVGGGKVVYDGPGIVYGTSYIGATSGDVGPTFDGKLFVDGGEGNIIRGKFDGTSNTDNSGENPAFLYLVYLGDGDSVTSECKGLVSGYWVVEPQGQVGTYTITVTPTENATYAAVYTDSGDEINPENNVYTVVSGKTITITATPAEGYGYATTPTGWTAGANGVITKEVSEAVAIPAPTAIQVPTYELTVPSVTGASAEVTSNSVVVADLTAIPSNTEVVVTWTATEGYKITAGATENITMDGNKTAAEPTVAAITYATLTITPVANCTIVVSNANDEVATGAKFDKDDAVQLTVYRTPADGYVLDNCLAVENIMMNTDQTVTAAVKVSGGSNWPSTWNNGTEPASMTTAFNNWIAVAGNDPTAENAEAAFLVGVNVANYTGAFAAASITLADGKVVITGNYDLTKINGVLSVKMGNEPNALNTTTVIGELTNGAISLTPALGETKKFYQLVIGYPAN